MIKSLITIKVGLEVLKELIPLFILFILILAYVIIYYANKFKRR